MIKLGILEAGQNLPALVPEHGTFAELFIRLLSQTSQHFDYTTFRAYKGELPGSTQSCEAYLITGSIASVYDEAPYMDALGKFVRDAARDLPVVGICFGHQLLHHIYDGIVEKSVKGWGIGVHAYEVYENRSWMIPAADTLNLIASHQDQVIQPAPGTRTLAGSAFCPIAISEFTPNIISFQPHPEITCPLAEKIYEMQRNAQGNDVTDTAMASMNNTIDDSIAAQWMVRFIEERVNLSE